MTKIQDTKAYALKVSYISIFVNLSLAILKLIAGVVGRSSAMISDAVHSASDVFSTLIVIVGVHISHKEEDAEHQYGHERMECIAAMFLAGVLAITGGLIGYHGIETIIAGNYDELATPSAIALVAAVISIAVKEGMFWYTRAAANKLNSGMLMADAWHHRSDALSSIGSFVGIAGAMLGFPILDPIAAVLIAVMILHAGYEIMKDSIDKLVDNSCSPEVEAEIRKLTMEVTDVLSVDMLKTRLFGSRIYVDIEISSYAHYTLEEGHDIAEAVHDAIEGRYSDIKHVMVHINPFKDEEFEARKRLRQCGKVCGKECHKECRHYSDHH